MWFDIYKSGSAAQPYWWVAKGENGEKLCHSEMLSSKQACINTISVIKQGAASAGVFDETGEVSGDVEARRIRI